VPLGFLAGTTPPVAPLLETDVDDSGTRDGRLSKEVGYRILITELLATLLRIGLLPPEPSDP
jgi:hypothetical protein